LAQYGGKFKLKFVRILMTHPVYYILYRDWPICLLRLTTLRYHYIGVSSVEHQAS